MIKKGLIASAILAAFAGNVYAGDKVLAGYLDVTATGSANKVNMSAATKDGYNMIIFAFADINGEDISFHNGTENITTTKLADAKNNGMKTLISVGGQINTYNPGNLDDQQISTLANNIVSFINSKGFDGIDFDLEVETDPTQLKKLISNIRQADPNMIITAAPQINGGKLVTTGNDQGYDEAIKAGLFNYLFLQEYNTSPEDQATFISDSFPGIENQVPSVTKLVVGQPTAAVAAGSATIYHSDGQTLTTPQATAKMIPELEKIKDDSQYDGMMGWSLNVDYDGADYGDSSHTPGSFAYGLKDCVINGQCDVPPTPTPPSANYTLQVSDTDGSSGIGATVVISDNQGDEFKSDWIAPATNKTYSKSTNPSTSSVVGKKGLTVNWTTYPGGPEGTCSGTFDFTKNVNVMVNPTLKSCDFGSW